MKGTINCKLCGKPTYGLVRLNILMGVEMFGICESCRKELIYKSKIKEVKECLNY